MLRTLAKTSLLTAGFVFGATSAQAASVNNAQLTLGSTGKITAIAADGQTYSKLESTDLNFHGSVHVTMSTGKVSKFAIYNGACGALCPNGFGYKQLFQGIAGTMNLDKDISFSVSAGDFPQGLTQNLEASKIFKACHDRMRRSVIGSDVTITHLMKVTLSLELAGTLPGTGLGEFNPGGVEHEWWDDYTVPVTVTCKALDQPQMPGGIVQDMGEFKTTGINLFLTTYPGATTQPNPATTCKKGRVLVRVNTSKAGPAKFKLWTKVGGAPVTSKVIDAWASFDGNGGFKAEHTEWVSVSEPTQVQAMAEDMVNGIGQSTQWKNITLQCTGAGGGGKGGGLTTQTDEPMAPPRTLKGEFSFVDHGAPKCAREGKALISFTSNQPGDVHYTLDCTNGQNFSGTAALVKNPAGGYVAAALKSFDVASSTVYSCALKSTVPGAGKLHQWKSHTYKCETPAIIPPVGGLQTAPRPGQEARKDAARIKAIEDAHARQQAGAERQRREALQARLKAAQNAAEAKRRQDALVAAQRLKAAQQRRVNALLIQQSQKARKRRATAPAVHATPESSLQRR